ncbi:hypothetical protein FSP39_003971 [Pinctada imbricata]|uniref:Uncharacterized protein n=1 Tax=Pinctada imbricata TaxID=66713 RepID=A0AA89BUT3_PINIB|nr:hypothetical protein FSP39_003971 [Pinctada imbricata]
MEINVAGLIVIIVLYVIILVFGVLASRFIKKSDDVTEIEENIVAGRKINVFIGIFTMTATIVGGGFINGSAESVATSGIVWTLAPPGIFLGLSLGGVIFAKKMRDRKYLTMLDPFQQIYGNVSVVLLYTASLCGDLFWTASILSALGTSLSVIIEIDLKIAILTSSAVTICYTMIGQMKAVALTDVLQLCFITFGLVLGVPFAITNDKVGSISENTDVWVGTFYTPVTPAWIDLFITMIFGTIPWQSYMQRVLSMKSSRQSQILSVFAGMISLVLVIPSILVGAIAVNADWSNTTLGMSHVEANVSSMVLPYVFNEFTPKPVAIIALGAICAAVMSSMDSSILGSSSMFTSNIYKGILRPKASDFEVVWIQRAAIFIIGAVATSISLTVPIIYGLFVLAADVVFVIILPQLFCVVYMPWTNSCGSVAGFIVGVLLRVGAGEPFLNFEPFMKYPFYNEKDGQIFPFRTFALLCSMVTIILISLIANLVKSRKTKSDSYEMK